jgi:hypothetical protein
MNLLVFGDQTADQYPLLKRACTWKNNATLTTFLDRISVVLREEVEKLPRTQRAPMPDFLTTWDLVEAYYTKGVKIPQLESCLVTIAQLAHYIGYVWPSRPHLTSADVSDTTRRTLQKCQTLRTLELSVSAQV